MNKNIKVVAGLLALSLAFSGGVFAEREKFSVTTPVTANAATYGDLTYYSNSDGTVRISDCNESVTSIEIPAEIDGKKVTSIGSSAFNDCTVLKSVTIPNSVTSIGSWAFKGCRLLSSIIIPDSVVSIEEYAFYDCASLKSVTLSESLTSIGDVAFYKCTNLTEITIPESVISIGDRVFQNCTKLEKITILNPECFIYDSSSTICNDYTDFSGTIYGYENSTAQEYAEKYNKTFVSIGSVGNPPETPVISDSKKGDINGDGIIDSTDASIILAYYSYLSTTNNEKIMSIDEFISVN